MIIYHDMPFVARHLMSIVVQLLQRAADQLYICVIC